MTTHHRPSFELELRKNAWAGGPRWGSVHLSTPTDSLARLRGPASKGVREERGGEVYPDFLGETPLPGHMPPARKTPSQTAAPSGHLVRARVQSYRLVHGT